MNIILASITDTMHKKTYTFISGTISGNIFIFPSHLMNEKCFSIF